MWRSLLEKAALLSITLKLAKRRDYLASVLQVAHHASALAGDSGRVGDGRQVDPGCIVDLARDVVDRTRTLVHRLLRSGLARAHALDDKFDPRPGREVVRVRELCRR